LVVPILYLVSMLYVIMSQNVVNCYIPAFRIIDNTRTPKRLLENTIKYFFLEILTYFLSPPMTYYKCLIIRTMTAQIVDFVIFPSVIQVFFCLYQKKWIFCMKFVCFLAFGYAKRYARIRCCNANNLENGMAHVIDIDP